MCHLEVSPIIEDPRHLCLSCEMINYTGNAKFAKTQLSSGGAKRETMIKAVTQSCANGVMGACPGEGYRCHAWPSPLSTDLEAVRKKTGPCDSLQMTTKENQEKQILKCEHDMVRNKMLKTELMFEIPHAFSILELYIHALCHETLQYNPLVWSESVFPTGCWDWIL